MCRFPLHHGRAQCHQLATRWIMGVPGLGHPTQSSGLGPAGGRWALGGGNSRGHIRSNICSRSHLMKFAAIHGHPTRPIQLRQRLGVIKMSIFALLWSLLVVLILVIPQRPGTGFVHHFVTEASSWFFLLRHRTRDAAASHPRDQDDGPPHTDAFLKALEKGLSHDCSHIRETWLGHTLKNAFQRSYFPKSSF